MTTIASCFDDAYTAVCKLVDVFEKGEVLYLSPAYQESQARTDHIDKLFKALGWDVGHDIQTNPYEQEVKIEKSVSTGAAKRRADYAFSLAPRFHRPVFLVEAKRPQTSIETADNYFQAIRYSWNTQLPVVVLTDFRSFHIIDSRHKPSLSAALTRKVKSFHFQEFRDREKFAEIYWLFSREACLAGSLSKYAQNLESAPRIGPAYQLGLFAGGYQSIDDLFLEQLDEYRETLARSFKNADNSLTGPQLTEMVQRTLDRLVFLRFLEDKLIEPEQIVQRIAVSKYPWKEFVAESKRLNGVYNGIVFKPHTILDKPGFLTSTEDFTAICAELSANDSPYDFNHIPVEILGRIYERFLGKIVTATPKRVRVEQKPGINKKSGVFYTPDWVVQYMADSALRPILAKKSPTEVLKVKVIDTSCGSGSFLIGAFDELLRHVGKWYFQHPKLAKPDAWVEQDGQWRISLKEKRKLLISCLYGVDIDPQAAEVAQLSLYLKLLEEETTSSAIAGQLEIHEALLPSLSRNIVVGNSLISTEGSSNPQLFPSPSSHLNAVDLRDTFSKVMSEGGFDLVIGNPPYIKEYTDREAFDGIRDSPYYQGKMDIWYLFACRALDILKENKGRLAFIATNNWITNAGAKKLRAKIIEDAKIERIIDFGEYKVFKNASIQTMILMALRASTPSSYQFELRRLEKPKPTLGDAQALISVDDSKRLGSGFAVLSPTIDREEFKDRSLTFSDRTSEEILARLLAAQNFKLNAATEVAQGIVPNPDVLSSKAMTKYSEREISAHHLRAGTGVFVLPFGKFSSGVLASSKYLIPLLEPQDVTRYAQRVAPRLELIYSSKKWTDQDALPQELMDHLLPFKRTLDARRETKAGSINWFNLHWPRAPHFFQNGQRILAVRKCDVPTFALVTEPVAVMMAFNVIKSDRIDMRYLTALLNSHVVRFWLRCKGKMQGEHFQIDKEPLLEIPLRIASDNDVEAIAKRVDFIRSAMVLKTQCPTDGEKEAYQRRIEMADEEIQDRIYDIYGLSQSDRDLIERQA